MEEFCVFLDESIEMGLDPLFLEFQYFNDSDPDFDFPEGDPHEEEFA